MKQPSRVYVAKHRAKMRAAGWRDLVMLVHDADREALAMHAKKLRAKREKLHKQGFAPT
jgi:hypothetical protein